MPITLPDLPAIKANSLVQNPGPHPKSNNVSPAVKPADVHPLCASYLDFPHEQIFYDHSPTKKPNAYRCFVLPHGSCDRYVRRTYDYWWKFSRA